MSLLLGLDTSLIWKGSFFISYYGQTLYLLELELSLPTGLNTTFILMGSVLAITGIGSVPAHKTGHYIYMEGKFSN